MQEPVFQIFECQNRQCRLRFPSNLSVDTMTVCPTCGSPLLPSGMPFSNLKLPVRHSNSPIRKLSLLLDNLRSTLNVGSIFRTADGAGVTHIYCCGTTPTPYHPKIIKTGLGAEYSIPWIYHRNALDVLDQIESETLILSLEASENSSDLFSNFGQIAASKEVLLILGNEVSGVDPELMRRSNFLVSLPMIGKKTSLNVAVAAGIAIYSLQFNF